MQFSIDIDNFPTVKQREEDLNDKIDKANNKTKSDDFDIRRKLIKAEKIEQINEMKRKSLKYVDGCQLKHFSHNIDDDKLVNDGIFWEGQLAYTLDDSNEV